MLSKPLKKIRAGNGPLRSVAGETISMLEGRQRTTVARKTPRVSPTHHPLSDEIVVGRAEIVFSRAKRPAACFGVFREPLQPLPDHRPALIPRLGSRRT